jgi:hypothetical protein
VVTRPGSWASASSEHPLPTLQSVGIPREIAQNLIFKIVSSSYVLLFCFPNLIHTIFVLLWSSDVGSSPLSLNFEAWGEGERTVFFQRVEKVCRLKVFFVFCFFMCLPVHNTELRECVFY